jgi:hypothetical protein
MSYKFLFTSIALLEIRKTKCLKSLAYLKIISLAIIFAHFTYSPITAVTFDLFSHISWYTRIGYIRNSSINCFVDESFLFQGNVPL